MTRLAKSILGIAALWLGLGLLALLYSGFTVIPKTVAGWVLFLLLAPLFLIFAEAFFHLLAALVAQLAKIPPFSWIAWWLRCEDGEGDPVLRFAAIAFGLLAIFLFALKLIYN